MERAATQVLLLRSSCCCRASGDAVWSLKVLWGTVLAQLVVQTQDITR